MAKSTKANGLKPQINDKLNGAAKNGEAKVTALEVAPVVLDLSSVRK